MSISWPLWVGLRRQKVRIQADQFVVVEIVDGQQRLTTIAILLKAISKELNKDDSAEAKLQADLEELLVKRDATSPLLIQTNQDLSNFFADYMRGGGHPRVSQATTAADRNLLEAIEESEAFVGEWKAQKNLIDLLDIIRNRLSLIFHEIDDEGLVYTVFEVLNGRGLDVTWFDKLKSLLMAIVYETGGGNKAATIDELHNVWREIYRTIGLRQVLNHETVRFAGTLKSKDQPNRPLDESSAVNEPIASCKGNPKKCSISANGFI